MPHELDVRVTTRQQLEEVVSRVSMRNTSLDFKWRFIIHDIEQGDLRGCFVQVAFERPDTNTGIMGTGYGRKELVEFGTYVSGVVKTCWLLIELVVRHELMEGFHFDGCRIFDPHNSVFTLCEVQKKEGRV